MKTLFYHGKTVDGNRFTVAGQYEEETRLKLGLSLCSNKDPFIKAVGRKKAEGKLLSHSDKGKFDILLEDEDPGIRTFIDKVKPLGAMERKDLKEIFTL